MDKERWVILMAFGRPIVLDYHWTDKVTDSNNEVTIRDYAGRIKGVFNKDNISGYYVSNREEEQFIDI